MSWGLAVNRAPGGSGCPPGWGTRCGWGCRAGLEWLGLLAGTRYRWVLSGQGPVWPGRRAGPGLAGASGRVRTGCVVGHCPDWPRGAGRDRVWLGAVPTWGAWSGGDRTWSGRRRSGPGLGRPVREPSLSRFRHVSCDRVSCPWLASAQACGCMAGTGAYRSGPRSCLPERSSW